MAETTTRKRKKRKKKNYLLRILITVALAIALFLFLTGSFFNIDKITVEDNHYFTDAEVITMADVEPGCNIFTGIKSSRIISRLTVDPYIEEVSVTRKLPRELVIDIKEKKQVAAVVYGDKFIVIDGEGYVLRITETEPKLTIIEGLTLTKITESEKLEAEENVLLTNTIKLLNAMVEKDMYFIKIEISELYTKAYIFKALVCKGSAENIIDSIETNKLQNTLTTMFEKDMKRGTLNISDGNYVSYDPKVE